MDRKIVGFSLDEKGHWLAELECGHRQHVRHDLAWLNRPWVLLQEGRAAALERLLPCRKCEPPADAELGDAVIAPTSS